jgi:hypothetical protein
MIEGPAIFQFGSFRRMSCHRSMFEPGFETRPDASGNGERRVDAAAAVYPHALYFECPKSRLMLLEWLESLAH